MTLAHRVDYLVLRKSRTRSRPRPRILSSLIKRGRDGGKGMIQILN